VKRAQTLKRLVTLSAEAEEEAGEPASAGDERHSTCEASTFGTLTKPSIVAPKHPPNLPGSSCGEPAKGSPPQAWKSAPSWQRVKVELSEEEEEEEEEEEAAAAAAAAGGGESEWRSWGPLPQPEAPPCGAKYVAFSP